MQNWFFIGFLFIACHAIGQQQVTPKFSFKDGIYLSFEDFQNNKPNFTWNDLKTSFYVNPKTKIARVSTVRNAQNEMIDDKQFWGICIKGKVYIRQQIHFLSKEQKSFSERNTFIGLRGQGKLCYLKFQAYQLKQVKMNVTNPQTGVILYSEYVTNDVPTIVEKVLHFETGVVEDFTVKNLTEWVKDDAGVVKTISELSEDEINERMKKLLLIYNERNPVYIVEN